MAEFRDLSSIGTPFAWPFRRISDALELRRLRRKLPNAHRGLVNSPDGSIPETDAQYLDRLRQIEHERETDPRAPHH